MVATCLHQRIDRSETCVVASAYGEAVYMHLHHCADCGRYLAPNGEVIEDSRILKKAHEMVRHVRGHERTLIVNLSSDLYDKLEELAEQSGEKDLGRLVAKLLEKWVRKE